MRFLVLSCVFPPEQVTSARTSYDVFKMAKREYEVVEVYCPTPSRGVSQSEGRIVQEGVHYLPSFKSKKSTFASRSIENISFGISCFFRIFFTKKYDACYVNSWPLFSVFFICLALSFKGTRIIYSIQDLYPESLVVRGSIKRNSIFYKVLKYIEVLNCSMADSIICISKTFKDYVLEELGVRDESKVIVIPNWPKEINSTAVHEGAFDTSMAARWRAKGRVLGYGGNFSFSTGVLELIRSFESKDDTHILVCGAGADLSSMIELSKSKAGTHIYSPWPRNLTNALYEEIDICLLPLIDGQGIASVPSKILDYASHKKPIICISNESCAATSFVEEYRLGVTVDWESFKRGLKKEFLDEVIKGYPSQEALEKISEDRVKALNKMAFLIRKDFHKIEQGA